MHRIAIRRGALPWIALVPALTPFVFVSCASIAGLGDYSTGSGDGGNLSAPEGGAPSDGASGGSIDVQADALDPRAIGLIAHVPFDEGTGTTARDVTGNGHDVSLFAAIWTSDGNGGSALYTSSVVPIHYYADQKFPSSKPFPVAAGTVVFLFRLDSNAEQRAENIYDGEDGSRNHVYARMIAGGNMELGLELDSSSAPDAGPPLVWSHAITSGLWTPVGLSWDSHIPAVTLRIGSSTWDVPPGVEQELSAFHADGELPRLLDECHDCAMDELRVYDRFMSKEEMKSLFR